MALSNTPDSYGAIAKSFHWLTAALILVMIPLGFVATQMAESVQAGSSAIDITTVTALFSLHKTLGVVTFFVALARILWALSQPHPRLIHGDRRAEAWAAETVHWVLYGSLVLVPLTGWIHHAASTGFAPIWGGFGQSLPLVPKSETLAALFSTLHFTSVLTLIAALGLHIAGALKHHLVDRDNTLRRMLPGRVAAAPSTRQPARLPGLASAALAFAVIWTGALTFSAEPPRSDAPLLLAPVSGSWQVTDGQLTLQITQLGNQVAGQFGDWTADIDYDPEAEGAQKGTVAVQIAITSLQLGSVTDQAMGPEYFDAGQFATAQFSADLIEVEGQLHAQGTLQIKDRAVPLSFPVALQLEGDQAKAQGAFQLDRRDFGIGDTVPDAGTLGFAVAVSFDLTALRS